MGWNADPGRREGLLPSLALGYLLTPLQGSQDEAAASLPLHFLKSVHPVDSRFRGMTEITVSRSHRFWLVGVAFYGFFLQMARTPARLGQAAWIR